MRNWFDLCLGMSVLQNHEQIWGVLHGVEYFGISWYAPYPAWSWSWRVNTSTTIWHRYLSLDSLGHASNIFLFLSQSHLRRDLLPLWRLFIAASPILIDPILGLWGSSPKLFPAKPTPLLPTIKALPSTTIISEVIQYNPSNEGLKTKALCESYSLCRGG